MKFGSFLNYFVPFGSVALLASCSNNMQPMSVNLKASTSIASTGNSSLAIRDMGWGGGQLWAVTQTARGSDFYLAKCNNANPNNAASSFQWDVMTNHWGLRCAVANSGRCYHVNANGELWWTTGNGGASVILILPTGNLKALDIGAGTTPQNGQDRLWVLFKDPQSKQHVYFGDYDGNFNGSGQGTVTWINEVILYNIGALLRISADFTGNINGDGQGVSALSTDGTYGIYEWDLDTHENNVPLNFQDIAACDGNYVYKCNPSFQLYKGTAPTTYSPTNRYGTYSVGMTKINGVVYVMYITTSNNFAFTTFSNF
jgi:hypothetical protein